MNEALQMKPLSMPVLAQPDPHQLSAVTGQHGWKSLELPGESRALHAPSLVGSSGGGAMVMNRSSPHSLQKGEGKGTTLVSSLGSSSGSGSSEGHSESPLSWPSSVSSRELRATSAM